MSLQTDYFRHVKIIALICWTSNYRELGKLSGQQSRRGTPWGFKGKTFCRNKQAKKKGEKNIQHGSLKQQKVEYMYKYK